MSEERPKYYTGPDRPAPEPVITETLHFADGSRISVKVIGFADGDLATAAYYEHLFAALDSIDYRKQKPKGIANDPTI